MRQNNPLFDIIQAQKEGKARGIYSVCSSNEFVIEACLEEARHSGEFVLIESTSNQVNQYGGYTGMNALQFSEMVKNIARDKNFPHERILLGGDHLGPNVWRKEPAVTAMQKSCELVAASVRAGYSKIHLDASMKCADDPLEKPLDIRVSAARAAQMCRAAEQARVELLETAFAPCYIIGTEVPVPGGTLSGENELCITHPEDARQTIDVTREAFYKLGLQEAWERVIALVVQPGVEFGDSSVIGYERSKARDLSRFIEDYDHLVYEAHSTDYQTPESLKQMVEDHFAILKVGPALTFAFREAVFALEIMEQEWLKGKAGLTLSNLQAILEKVMLNNPEDWAKYYEGDERYLRFARKYSYSDRSRYYWPDAQVQASLGLLIDNLSRNPVPLSLLHQYMPLQYKKVMAGNLDNHPIDLIYDRIIDQIKDYARACYGY